MSLLDFSKHEEEQQGFVYTEEQLMARLKFFIGICLSLTLTGIVFVVLYSLIFVTQPLNAISPIDQKFFELIVPIATFLTGTLSGIMLAGNDKEAQKMALQAATRPTSVSPMPPSGGGFGSSSSSFGSTPSFGSVTLTSLSNVTATSVLYYNAGTGATTYGPVPSGGGGGTTIPLIPAADTTATSTSTGKLVSISDNGGRLAYYNNTITNWLYVGTDAVVYSPPAPPPSGPPVTDYIAWYDITSFTGSMWNDKSGNGYNGTVGGSPTVVSVSGNGGGSFSAIQGGTSDYIAFPSGILPSTYTLFYIARYNGSSQQRIYTVGGGDIWLSGHHDHKAGVAYHQGGTSAMTSWTDYYGTDWVLVSDQNTPNLFRTNGVVRTFSPNGVNGGAYQIGVNIKSGENSDWQTAECIVYNRTLSGGEISSTEAYLSAKYGITI